MQHASPLPSLTPSLDNTNQLLRKALRKLAFPTAPRLFLARSIEDPLDGLSAPLFDGQRDRDGKGGSTTSCAFESFDAYEWGDGVDGYD